MKTLYLIRHAKSSWDFPGMNDFDRPLSSRGERDAPIMGQRLSDRNIKPDLLLTSPANRALSTCKIIASAINYPKKTIETNRDIYHAGEKTLLRVVNNINDFVHTLFLFGHNPGFTDFACSLTKEDIYNIPTCGIVAIEFNLTSWTEVKFSSGHLLFFDYPKKEH